MLILTLIFVLGLYYMGFKLKTKGMMSEVRTHKLTKLLNRLVLLSPLVGLIIFTFLFSTLLKGRFIDRSSHALIVFTLWMYATSFYVEMLRYYKNKRLFILSISGMVLGVALAIMLTPLDRYCSLINSGLYPFTYVLGICLVVLIYITNTKANQK